MGENEAVRSRLGDRLDVTARARRALVQSSRGRPPQHLLLSWPAGATLVPANLHEPAAHEAIVGHLARCPIFIDLRQLARQPRRRVLLDVDESRRASGDRVRLVVHDSEPRRRALRAHRRAAS